MLRGVLLFVNGAVAVLFTVFLAYTLFATAHIEALGREFVVHRTQRYADPLVEVAEQGLESPLTRKVLTDKQIAGLRHEIDVYRAAPRDYIAQLAGERFPARMQGFAPNPLLQRAIFWKEGIRAHVIRVLSRLVRDLRIFAGSNLLAALAAVYLASRAPGHGSPLQLAASGLLLLASAYCVWLYIDSFSFFTILFDAYLGWGYPVLLAAVFAGLWLDYGRTLGEHMAPTADPLPKHEVEPAPPPRSTF